MNAISEKLLCDEEFLKKTASLSPEEAQKAFEAEGGDITIDELNEFAAAVNKFIANPDSEFSEEDLDAVAGGLTKWQAVKLGAGIAVGIAITCYPW